MPDGDVLDARMLGADLRDGALEAAGESRGVRLEFLPPVLELALAYVVQRLPVVVDDEADDLDAAVRERVQGS